MPTLVPLTATNDCASSDGGIYKTALVDCDEITDVTFGANGEVTAFVMASVGAWEIYVFDDDDSAFYNQSSTRTNRKITVNGEASFKYSGLNIAIVEFANEVIDFCCLVAVHFLNNGQAIVQGVEYDSATTTWKHPKQKPRMAPTINTNTGADEDSGVFVLSHVGGRFSPITTLSQTDIEAL